MILKGIGGGILSANCFIEEPVEFDEGPAGNRRRDLE